jgi:hypothetical protein
MSDQEHAKVLRGMADDLRMNGNTAGQIRRNDAKADALEAGAAALDDHARLIARIHELEQVVKDLEARCEHAERTSDT